MKIIHYKDAQPVGYPGGPDQATVGRVVIGQADGAKKFCMRVFELPPEAHSAKHSHDWEHEVFVHAGKGAIYHEGEWVSLTSGSVIFIPAGEGHQLKNIGSEPFIFVCVIPSGAPEI